MGLRIYNTLTKDKAPFEPMRPGKVGMYVCGPTVYDMSHVGHARVYVAFDVVARYLRSSGYEVTYVRNFTDVDDKIIKRAAEQGRAAREFAETYVREFHADMDALGVERATVEPKVSDHVPEIVGLIQRIVDRGFAYVAGGDVYFAVRKFDRYTKLSGRNLDEMEAGARVEPGEQKKDPLDTLFDLVLADNGQSGALYFIANEEDLQYGLKQPFTSIGLDASESPLDGPLYEPHGHPRAFGSMPRFLGHYARDLHMLPLEQAIRKITSMPAQREHLVGRGLLKEGFFADVTVFDPATIMDKATYAEPTRLSEGVKYVFVNGQLAFADGRMTGANAGHVLRGPGAR